MLHDHERHAAVGGHGAKQILESVQPTGRRADPHDRRRSARRGRILSYRRLQSIRLPTARRLGRRTAHSATASPIDSLLAHDPSVRSGCAGDEDWAEAPDRIVISMSRRTAWCAGERKPVYPHCYLHNWEKNSTSCHENSTRLYQKPGERGCWRRAGRSLPGSPGPAAGYAFRPRGHTRIPRHAMVEPNRCDLNTAAAHISSDTLSR